MGMEITKEEWYLLIATISSQDSLRIKDEYLVNITSKREPCL